VRFPVLRSSRDLLAIDFIPRGVILNVSRLDVQRLVQWTNGRGVFAATLPCAAERRRIADSYPEKVDCSLLARHAIYGFGCQWWYRRDRRRLAYTGLSPFRGVSDPSRRKAHAWCLFAACLH